MQEKPVALVTGANKGIGRQIAIELIERGFDVLVGSRDPVKGNIAAQSMGQNAHAIQLDVTDQNSIGTAAERIKQEFGRLDVLINNAGISHAGKPGTPFSEILKSTHIDASSISEIRTVFDTNVFGVILVTQAMLPLLRLAPAGRIVNVSSGAGSLTNNADSENPGRVKFGTYGISKAALNAVTLAFSIDLEGTNIKVNAACPGFTSTDLNNFEGVQTVEQAAQHPVSLALLGPEGPTGTFSGINGTIAW